VVFGLRAAESISADLASTTRTWPQRPAFVGEYLPEHLHDHAQMNPALRTEIQTLMWEKVGLYRDASGLERAQTTLQTLADQPTYSGADARAAIETANMLLAAQLITASALARRESRGAHARRDFPAPDPFLAGQHFYASNHQEAQITRSRAFFSSVVGKKDLAES
jgi:L-aspartate oxidase